MTRAMGPRRLYASLSLILAASPAATLAQWAPNGVGVCVASGGQTTPAIAPDGANGSVVAWIDARFGTADVFAQRVGASGTPMWSGGGVAVCTAANAQSGVTAATDFASGAMLFWVDRRPSLPGVYAQRLNSAGVPLWAANGVGISTSSANPRNVLAIHDGSNGFVIPRGYLVAWYGEGLHGTYTIRVQRVNTEGVGFFTGGEAQVCNSPTFKGRMVMAGDGTSVSTLTLGAVLAWSEDRVAGSGSDIYVRRVNALGVPQWTADGIKMCGSLGAQFDAAIANVGADDCIVAWSDERTPDRDIYAQRIDSTGLLFWLANGLPVCRAMGTQSTPEIVRDGAGGAFIAWVDNRTGASQIYAQRIDGNGAPLWALDGVSVCTSAPGADGLKLFVDGAGGFFAAWRDTRTDTGDLFAQRVNASGGVMWSSSGEPLTTAPSTQLLPAITGGSGGLIAAWEDNRTGVADVYANFVSASGVITAAPTLATTTPLLSLVSENPSRDAASFLLALPEPREVSLGVYDVRGRSIRSLASSRAFTAGTHTLMWNGADDAGAEVPAGVYFVRLHAGGEAATSTVVLVH